MWLMIDTLELSGTSDSFPHSTENTIKTTNHTINIFMTLCDHCPYFFRLPRSGSDSSRPLQSLHHLPEAQKGGECPERHTQGPSWIVVRS
jgi:hypothetical protein